MNPGIFLIQENGDLVEMIETPPYSEALLQTWLEKYPSLLAGHQIDPSAPRRWLLVERECGVPSEEGRRRALVSRSSVLGSGRHTNDCRSEAKRKHSDSTRSRWSDDGLSGQRSRLLAC